MSALGRDSLDYKLGFAIFYFFSNRVKKVWVVGRKCDFVKCMDHIHKERLGAVLRKWEVKVLSVLDEGDADQAQFKPREVRRVREFVMCTLCLRCRGNQALC